MTDQDLRDAIIEAQAARDWRKVAELSAELVRRAEAERRLTQARDVVEY